MSAFDTPWLESMSKSSTQNASSPQSYDVPTVAAFAPTSSSGYSATAKQRSTVIVHKKSPLLIATPPQITRALAHSHPFILPLNKLAGLLSWSTDDPWESFLLVAIFWAGCLYGNEIVRYATPINAVVFLILGMYSRRYSPLSSTSKTGEKHEKSHKRTSSTSPQHKSLDEIVETMTQFTTRCNLLLEPFLQLTDFLSTQQTATSATTRPALTTLFLRIILVTPLWVFLTLPPFYILTPRRTILAVGTIILTWHSRPARVSRVILWRSVVIRRVSAFVTGLNFNVSTVAYKSLAHQHANDLATRKRRPDSSGIRFTFILFENQRRWIGLGWTSNLFAYEREPWTDEHLNPVHAKEEFELPTVDGGHARWRWITGSSWQIENGDAKEKSKDGTPDGGGWIYYDNKWNGPRNTDGWGRYTRRRKWFRDAELVEITPSMEPSPIHTPVQSDVEDEEAKIRKAKEYAKSLSPTQDLADSVATIVPSTPDDSVKSTKRKSGWFGRKKSYNESVSSVTTGNRDRSVSKSSTTYAQSDQSNFSNKSKEDDLLDQWRDGPGQGKSFGVGEDVVMGLG